MSTPTLSLPLARRSSHRSSPLSLPNLYLPISPYISLHLPAQITQKLSSLRGLASRLQEVDAYLQNVLNGRLPINHQIIYGLQDVFNLLPNTDVDSLVKAFAVKTNDMMLAVYLSSIIRSVLALHNLINNKLYNKEKQLKQEKGDADDKEKAKEKPDGKENEKADGKAADGKDKPADKK